MCRGTAFPVRMHVCPAKTQIRMCIRAVYLITKTRLFKYIENFTTKNENFQMKNSGSVHISALNLDCGYPCTKLMYTLVNPSFTV